MKEKKINKEYKKVCKFLSSEKFRKPIKDFIDDNCEKMNTENIQELHKKFVQMIEESYHNFLKENEIDEQLHNLFVQKSLNDTDEKNKEHFQQLELIKSENYLKTLLNKRNVQIIEKRRKKEEEERQKEEEERKKKEKKEEERKKKEEEERKKKEEEEKRKKEEERKRKLEEKKEKNKKKKSKIGGKIVILGNLDLTFKLKINEKIIKEKDSKVKFSDISSIKDCKFLLDHEELWDQIKMISGNKTLIMLLSANKIFKKKIPIDYITLDKMNYNDEQVLFERLITHVTQNNNLFLHDSKVCKCNIDIKMNLICGKEEKEISIINSKNNPNAKKENNINEEENKENDKTKKIKENKDEEKESKLKKINEPSFDSFEYIFIDFNDFNNSEISSVITLEELKEFFKEIKQKQKLNIILNVEKGNGKLKHIIELLKYPDIYIFNNIENTYNLFQKINEKKKENERKKEEDVRNKKSRKSKKDIKEDKNQEENDNKIKLNNENNEEKKEKENEDINIKKKKKKEKKNNNNKKDFDKRKVYEFFSETICKSCDIPFKEKIGIFINDFNKLIIIKVRNKDEPFEMINYDLKCYPKVNPHNIEIIEEYKKIIKENYEEYSNILLGCNIQKICEGGATEENIYMSYLSGIEIIKKKIEFKRYDLKEPTESNFFKVNPSKNVISRKLSQLILRKKEGQFKLDCDNKKKSKYIEYNPLLDKNLNLYFKSHANEQRLKTGRFITEEGNIIYDNVYKESLSPFLKNKKDEKIKGEGLIKIINEFKISKDLKNKEKIAEEEITKKNIVLELKLPNIKIMQHQFDFNEKKKSTSQKKIRNKDGEYNEKKEVKEDKGKINKKITLNNG